MRRAVLRRGAAAVAAAVLAAGLVLVTGPAAQAHADIAWTVPPAGERVEQAPDEVVLQLTEAVVLDRTTVTLVDARGVDVALPRPTLTRDDDLDVRSPVSLHVALPDLAPSTYHVAWRTVSADDMHSTYGTFVFGVGTDVTPDPSLDGVDSAGTPRWRAPIEAALRWLGFVGLAALLGATVVDLLDAGAHARARRLARRGGALACTAAVGTAGLLLAADAAALTSSRYGAVWAGYSALLGAATALARRAENQARLRTQVAVLAAASVAAAVSALVGHPAGASATPARTALVTAAHLLATALWSGMLVALVAVRARRGLLRRVALVAAPAVGVSALTGLVLAGLLVPSTGALGGSAYGRLMTVKVVLVTAAALLGAVNATRARRRARRTPVAGAGPAGSRVVTAEALVLVTVLGAAALLGTFAPPTSPRWAPTPTWQADSEPRTAAGDDLLVTVVVTPNRPGSAFVATQVVSTRRPDPGPVTGVDVAVGDLTAVPAADQGGGTWLSPAVDLRRSGPAGVTVTVHRADLPDTTVRVPWTVAPRPGTQAAGAATAPAVRLAVTLLGVTLVLAATGLAGAAWRGRRRRPQAPADAPAPGPGPRDDGGVVRVAQTAGVGHSGIVTANRPAGGGAGPNGPARRTS